VSPNVFSIVLFHALPIAKHNLYVSLYQQELINDHVSIDYLIRRESIGQQVATMSTFKTIAYDVI
jgi:hypothetical protein